MKTQYKYIEFTPSVITDGSWMCANRKGGSILGEIAWYAPWRTYVCQFESDCVFSVDCLRDIADFLSQLNAGKKVAP